jgi:hypothetical protein
VRLQFQYKSKRAEGQDLAGRMCNVQVPIWVSARVGKPSENLVFLYINLQLVVWVCFAVGTTKQESLANANVFCCCVRIADTLTLWFCVSSGSCF